MSFDWCCRCPTTTTTTTETPCRCTHCGNTGDRAYPLLAEIDGIINDDCTDCPDLNQNYYLTECAGLCVISPAACGHPGSINWDRPYGCCWGSGYTGYIYSLCGETVRYYVSLSLSKHRTTGAYRVACVLTVDDMNCHVELEARWQKDYQSEPPCGSWDEEELPLDCVCMNPLMGCSGQWCDFENAICKITSITPGWSTTTSPP